MINTSSSLPIPLPFLFVILEFLLPSSGLKLAILDLENATVLTKTPEIQETPNFKPLISAAYESDSKSCCGCNSTNV